MNNNVPLVTYPELLKFYYLHSFPAILGSNANSVAHGIMYKWNELIRPAEFRMSNTELGHLSGKEFNVSRSRQRVCELCKVNSIPLFTYISNGTQRAGLYKINVNLVSNLSQTKVNLRSNFNHIDNDPKEKESKDKDNYDHDRSLSQNENEEKPEEPPQTSYSDHTIILGAIMRKWGSQIIQQPPLTQVMAALQEHPRKQLLEAIDRAPLVLKECDSMKIVGFMVKVADNPTWYLPDDVVNEIKSENAKERLKEKRLIGKCEASLRSALRENAENEIYGYIRFLARHNGKGEVDTFAMECPGLSKPLDYYKSIWKDPGNEAYE